MTSLSKKEAVLLFFGDIFFFIFSLWASLSVRFGEFPTTDRFVTHFIPFSLLFVIWLYFLSGLYEKHTLILKSKLPSIIWSAQLINSIFAIVFFYTLPIFGIAPKTLLFVYLIVSFLLALFWRLYGIDLFKSGQKQPAFLIGSGDEMKELLNEVNSNSHYDIHFISSVDVQNIGQLNVQEDIITPIYSNDVKIVVIDFSHENVTPLLPHLYNLIFSKVRFIDSHKIYEDVFDRIPLSLVTYSWFLENISATPSFTYDFLKRVMDIIISVPLLLVPIVTFPFAFIAVKLEDGGHVFISQERIGKDNQKVQLYKFRSMSKNITDLAASQSENKITRIGNILRKTRLDEFPQLWNVIRGDISLIGPRPELPSGVVHYEKQIPFYNVRHLIKPGLSGWAQLYHDNHPHHGFGVEETKEKLSYDLFYIKNRSFFLDIKIALKTIKTLLSRSGI